MKKHFFSKSILVLSVLVGVGCSGDDEKKPSYEDLLTGKSTKSWKITFASDDTNESDESCKAFNEFTADNRWIFKTENKFEFDNGTLVEIADCETCDCSDLAHLVGTWKIELNALSIKVNGRVEEDGDITDLDEQTILISPIKSLTENELQLGVSDAYIKFVPAE